MAAATASGSRGKGLSACRSTGCLIQGNTFDATGTQFVQYPASNGVISDQGASGCQYVDNTIVNISSTGLSGFFFYTAVRPTAQGNVVAPARTASLVRTPIGSRAR